MFNQADCKIKTGSFLICLAVLLSGFLWSLLAGSAGATNTVGDKTYTLTITINDNGSVTTAATLPISDLQGMEQVKSIYSSVDNGSEVLFYAAEGVLLTDILTRAGIDFDNVSKFTFTGTDDYARTLTKEYLLDMQRYYYPNIADNLSTQGGEPVLPLLALKSGEFEDKNQLNFNQIDDYYSARLFFGQTEQDLVSNKNYVKWIDRIEVFTKPASAQAPALSADMANNDVGLPVTLTFTDDPAWRAAISDVTVDGNSIQGKYTVAAGAITIEGTVFDSEKDYAVVIKAEGYLDAAVMQHKGSWPVIFTVDGAAVTASSFTAPELRSMQPTTIQFGTETCTGVALKDILTALDITNGSWQAQINVTDADTYPIAPVSVAELLNPANKYLLTYDIGGQPITIGPNNETPLRVYWGIGIVYKHVTGITVTTTSQGGGGVGSVTLELSKYTAQPGDSVTASGTADANTWVSIKVLDSAQSVIVFDAVRSDAGGNYSCTFKIPSTAAGSLTVVAGYGGNVANKTITVDTTPGDDTIAPTWPSKELTYSGLSQSGVTLSWSEASDNVEVTGYKVYKDGVVIDTVGTTRTYNVTDLSPDTAYTFTVQALDAAGNESADGPSVDVKTLVSTVNVTLELSQYTAQREDSVTASGTADANTWVSIKVLDSAQSVIVFDAVRSDAEGNYSCTFKIPSTAAGSLTVVAGYGVNVANKTITVDTTPGDDTIVPSWPSKELTYSGLSQSGVTLSWSEASDNVEVTGYKVYKDGAVIDTVGTTRTYNVTGLTAGTEYTFTVQAVDAAGNESADGPSVDVTTAAEPDTTAPTWTDKTLTVSNVSQSGVTLSWSEASDNVEVTGYKVCKDGVVIDTVGTTRTYNVTGLTAGTEYTFTVQALDAAGNESADGPSVTVTTAVPITDSNVTIADDGANKNLIVTQETPDAVNITVPGNVTDATVIVSVSQPDEAGMVNAALPALNIAANTSVSTDPIQVSIPAGTTISAPEGWGGTVHVPTVQSNDSVTVTPDSGNTATVNAVIEIGYGDVPLTFNKAVRILIPGQAGKDAGYSRGGKFTKITTILTADTQEAGDALPSGGEGRIDVGNDLVIWTKHFTKFVTYTQTVTSSSSSSGGSNAPQPVNSTTGAASVSPAAGGKISLGDDVSVNIPAGALKGTTKVDVTIQEVGSPPAAPSGFKLLGAVYEFKAGGDTGYSFNKPVTLTFTFDTTSLPAGETPAVYYYDEAASEWVDLGGTVSGSTITAQVDHFTKFAVLAAGEEEEVQQQPEVLKDISGHWAEGNINELVSLGAIAGYPDGSFRPDNSITRAEFATVLAKVFKLAPQNGKVFTDTAAHWARDYIATVAANGIVNGYDDTTFGPDDLITREQMAVMVVKAAGLATAAGETSFADSGSISVWAGESVAAAVENGIMSGYPDNTVRPVGNATRAEAATVIVKALDL